MFATKSCNNDGACHDAKEAFFFQREDWNDETALSAILPVLEGSSVPLGCLGRFALPGCSEKRMMSGFNLPWVNVRALEAPAPPREAP